ncbi:MAG TPA: histidine ammonia-lyase [Chthonomonadales bacterium]|nr:histidine ammonia-lyase [Chthonomonadales bacterium]
MITLDGKSFTLEEMEQVSHGAPVAWSAAARERVGTARRFVEQIVERGDVVYGVNTGFGALADVTIAAYDLRQLQLNLVRSHAAGVGPPLSREAVRAMMAQRANVLALGNSGCRPALIDTLIAMLNNGVHPVVPSKGSVGASGDLAPLAHLALVIVGEGRAEFQDAVLGGAEAMGRGGVAPLSLEAREGLALLNGTQAMCSVGGLALLCAERIADAADVAGGLTLEALRGTPTAFDERIQQARPHPGQMESARRLRKLIAGSPIRESHRDPRQDPRVQDAYSLRCIPQVHGAVRGALAHVRSILEIEINSATDNPLIFPEAHEVLSGGNFHGAPIALALDYAAIAVADLGAISERRVERLVNPALSGLPAFLAHHPGTNSGLMLAQVTAAALIAENNVLAHPASVLSLPTSANREDHVSMGMTAALKFAQVVQNVRLILAIELMCAVQAIEFLHPLKPGPILQDVLTRVREYVPELAEDMPLSDHITALANLVEELGCEAKWQKGDIPNDH